MLQNWLTMWWCWGWNRTFKDMVIKALGISHLGKIIVVLWNELFFARVWCYFLKKARLVSSNSLISCSVFHVRTMISSAMLWYHRKCPHCKANKCHCLIVEFQPLKVWVNKPPFFMTYPVLDNLLWQQKTDEYTLTHNKKQMFVLEKDLDIIRRVKICST
jgi:hypothetical protein